MKRDDGDHVTIWVDRDFVEESEGLVRRQGVRPNGDEYRTSISRHNCDRITRVNHTGPNSPTTGGLQAIERWTRANRGGWVIRAAWKTLIIGGSNTGNNAAYRVHQTADRQSGTVIGTEDVQHDMEWTNGRAREFTGGWRARSKGTMRCAYLDSEYDIVKTSTRI